jgi:hypothetical protein
VVGAIVRTRAHYRQPGFDAGGWDGPAVTLKFTSARPPASVFIYYAHRATELGWIRTGNKNVLGYPEGWTKTYPGGTRGDLTLIDLGIRTPTHRTTSTYILNASS